MNDKQLAKKISNIRIKDNHSVLCFTLKEKYTENNKIINQKFEIEGVYNQIPKNEKSHYHGLSAKNYHLCIFDMDRDHYACIGANTAPELVKEFRREFPGAITIE
jgi:hypothetical protein|tara:strand:+ start:1126 stop:1440 length:315 start_codon:yes stop_codon:yes gene_type:complete